MAVPSTFADLNTTPASNTGLIAGADAVGVIDDQLRSVYAFIASIYSNSGNGWTSPYLTTASPSYTGTASCSVADGTSGLTLTGNSVGGSVSLRPDGTNGGAVRWGGSGSGAGIFRFLTTGDTEVARFDGSGNFRLALQSSVPTLSNSGEAVLTRVSNTVARLSMRGDDGITRSVDLTLA